jgi:hypothetical protein
MLSVNIPVFNIEVSDLVMQIKKQAEILAIDYDIRIYDDCSDDSIKLKNRWLQEIPHVIYLELPKNIGRSAIRNKMGFDSTRRYQLFIDADSRLVTDRFLEKYLNHASGECVICGGTSYSDKKPVDTKKMLRWKYGHVREAVPASIRADKKGFIISSNNFFIESNLFKKVHFREELNSYGHEDTLLGLDLFINGTKPLHIDNPVEHTGIEDSIIFLDKTRNALKNLLQISKTVGENGPVLKSKMNFLKQYEKLTVLIPQPVTSWLFKQLRVCLERQLTGKNPRIFLFDLYKLGYYAEINR